MLHCAVSTKKQAYTKQCINVYVIHAHVHIYPLQCFFIHLVVLSV